MTLILRFCELFSPNFEFSYYEYEADTLFALDEHKSSDPQRGMCFLPRRALNVSDCEIARAFKVYGTSIEPISFVVPRKVCHVVYDIIFVVVDTSSLLRLTPSKRTSFHLPRRLLQH